MSQKPIGVGIVGYGNSARTFHLPFILANPSLKVVAFLQRAAPPAKGEKPAKPHCTVDYPDAKHYQDMESFLADGDVELVCVLTGHDAHFECARDALKAKKHVVVEKPFVTKSEDADELLRLQKESGTVLTGFQNRRYDSDFLTLKKIIESGSLGEIVECNMYYDFHEAPWVMRDYEKGYKPGGGMAFGLGSHTMDQALTLFGTPKSVTGIFRVLRHPGEGFDSKTEDTFTILLQYGKEKNGLLVEVKTCLVSVLTDDIKFIAKGRDGTFIKFGVDQQEPQVQKGMKVGDAGFAEEPERMHGRLTTRTQAHPSQKQHPTSGYWEGTVPSEKGDYTGYYGDVARAIRGEIPVYVDPLTVRNGIKIIELARQSWEEGRTVPFN